MLLLKKNHGLITRLGPIIYIFGQIIVTLIIDTHMWQINVRPELLHHLHPRIANTSQDVIWAHICVVVGLLFFTVRPITFYLTLSNTVNELGRKPHLLHLQSSSFFFSLNQSLTLFLDTSALILLDFSGFCSERSRCLHK